MEKDRKVKMGKRKVGSEGEKGRRQKNKGRIKKHKIQRRDKKGMHRGAY
jgi:hypothetical protein